MSRDIRSFFTVGTKAKAPSVPTTSSPVPNKRKPIVLDSDSDDDSRKKQSHMVANGKANSGKKDSSKSKKRRIIESSDDDDENKQLKNTKPTLASKVAKLAPAEKKLKPVAVSTVFGNEPIKRIDKERKTPKKPNAKTLLDNADDDVDLLEIDEALLSPQSIKVETKPSLKKEKSSEKLPKSKSKEKLKANDVDLMEIDEIKRSPKSETKPSLKKEKSSERLRRIKSNEKLKTKSPAKEHHHRSHSSNNNKSPSDRIDKASPVKDAKLSSSSSKGHKRSESNRSHTDSDDKVSHKRKNVGHDTPSSSKKPTKKAASPSEDLDLSVYDPDQERHERKRATIILYQKFQNRAGPSKPGSKEIPKGTPTCLSGMTFVITGVLESMEKDEAAQVIKDFGGRVTSAISGKTTHLVAGDDSGPAKMAKAEQMDIPILSEDDLLDLIREKSGLPTKSKKKQSPTKEAEVEEKIKSDEKKIKKKTHESPAKKSKSPAKPLKVERDEKSSPSEIKIKQEPPTPKDDVALAWVDKYKPKTVKDIIGQQGASSNCEKLIKWLSNWHKNNNGKAKSQRPNPWAKNDDGAFFKAALLSGPPGVGKTTTAQLVCQHLGFDTIEFNASDTRSKKLLQVEVSELLSNKTLHGYFNGRNSKLTEKQVLLMDEVDGMAGNEDRGGMQELISLIKTSSVPIICMCNDRNHPKIRSLVNYCFDLRFARPRMEQIKSAIMSICFKEKVKIPPKTIEEIIQATNNDIRQTVNSISLLSAKTALPDSKLRNDNGKKDLKLGPWEVVRKVFSAEEHKNMTLNDKSDLFFHDYSMGPLFVQQNYLSVAPNVPKAKVIEQVALAADSLSLGDLVENRIRSRMAWSMLPVQAMYSSVMPGEYMVGHFTSQINFPGWLGKYSKTQKRSRLAQEIHDHTRLRTSGSRQSIRLDYAPFLLKNITQPLIDDKMDGVEEALSVMKEYRLLREDIDGLVELTSWPGKKNPMDSVDGKVKAALTRTYNKEVAPYSYSVISGVKKKKASGADDDYINELGEDGDNVNVVSSDEEDDDKLDKDVLIKAKKTTRSTAAASTSKNSKPSTSGRSGTKKSTANSKKK